MKLFPLKRAGLIKTSLLVSVSAVAPAVFADDAGLAPVQAAAESAQTAPGMVASVRVDQVEFIGNRTFTSEQLQQVIAGDLGRPMNFQDMKALAGKIRDHYQRAGYKLAKVVVPRQEFAAGKPLRLTILEGWLGKVVIEGNQRYQSRHVSEALAASGIMTEQAFTLDEMERVLTRLNRQSGIKVGSVLKPGSEAGSTDVLIRVSEAPRVQAALEVNNYGSKNTGEVRVQPMVELVNLTGRGDALAFIGQRSLDGLGTYFARVGYTSPINARGTKASVYYAKGNVQVGGQFSVLNVQGDNTSWGVGVSQDLVRSAQKVYLLEAWLESQDLTQQILGTVTAEDKIRKLRIGLSRDSSDARGRTLAAVNLHVGLGTALGGMPNNSPLSSRSIAGADNQFTKLTLDWARLQRLTPRLVLIPRLSGQYTSTAVVSGEQWGIGGFSSVVGHAPASFAGDRGYTVNLEGRYALQPSSDRYQLTMKLDHARIFVRDTVIGQRSSEQLSGISLGLLAIPFGKLNLRFDYALPLGGSTQQSAYTYMQIRYDY